MKKLIALVIAAMMVLSMIPVMAITTSAADVEGIWTVWRDPKKYEDVEEGDAIKPDAGYEYTDDGFTTISPDWTNYTPAMAVQTKEAQPLKEGFYVQFRADDYPYGGEDGQDHWLAFTISDREGVTPGGMEHGNNWLCLIRGAGSGAAECQSFVTTMTTEEAVGNFGLKGSTSIEIPMGDDGREIYTLEITFDGTNYDVKVNGLSVAGVADVSTKLNEWVASGEYYVGISTHSGVKDASTSISILKYGTSAEDAITPVGTDSLEPEDNMLVFGELADPSTVPANTPALLFDATRPTFKKDPTGVDIKLTAQGDNSYHITATGGAPYWQWGIKSELTYAISDFPVFSMVLKNFWGDNGGIYYCAGNIMSCNDNYKTSWSIYDDGCMMFGENEEYSLVVVDLADLELIDEALTAGTGRIHNVRPFFSVTDTTDPEIAEWDVMYMGWFRSVEEAQQYAMDRLQMAPVTEAPETDAPETQAPAVQDTEAPAEGTQAPADGTQAPDAGAETDAPAGGCASVIGVSAVAILAAAAAAVALKKKD